MAINIKSPTIQNLEAAFAGECMAHAKYRYFAKICRAAGDEVTAKVFEATADQEILHAFGHAELLFAQDTMTPEKCLQYAIEGETYEYTEMYPKFRHEAMAEGHDAAVKEIDEQIAESKAHAEMFAGVLAKAAKRFAALAKVEEKHAHHYQAQKDKVSAKDKIAA
ncbi:MAG: rubrerythrin [Hydrogenophilaceae bacterium]|nr:rubrerythrin [Hydrogenophilaceae bacterium]